MKRLGAIVLFSGAVLLSTRMLAPGEPPPPPRADVAKFAMTAAVAVQISQVDAEVERLRKRLETQPSYPVPARDPFQFGKKPPATAPSVATTASSGAPAAPASVVLEPPKIVLPQLIAITASQDESVHVRTAVLGIGDNVQIVKTGDAFGEFVVQGIGVDSVDLVHSASRRTSTIRLH